MPTLEEKYETLQGLLRGYGSVLVAYSSGVDSTFLLRVAHDVLGDRCYAVTATAASFPNRERNEALDYADELGVRHEIFFFDEFSVPGFAENPENCPGGWASPPGTSRPLPAWRPGFPTTTASRRRP